jgi:hypothetical protein
VSERNSTFGLLCLGAGLFLAATLWLNNFSFDFPLQFELFTALFGLPYVARELRRRTNWLAVGYFLLLVPAIHRLAWEVGLRVLWHGDGDWNSLWILRQHTPGWRFLAGLAGGFVGALSLLVFAMPRMRSPGARALPLIGGGIAALALLAALIIGFRADYASLIIYLPWQVAFAFFLSRLLRPSPPRDAASG